MSTSVYSRYTTPKLHLNSEDASKVGITLKLMSHYLTSDYPGEMTIHLVNFLLLQIVDIFQEQNISACGASSRTDELYRLFRKLLVDNYRKEHGILFYADSLHVSRTYLSRVIKMVSGKTVNAFISDAL